ncbi:hypothetical protein IU447_21300 [Nocardia farcinica]|uniref:hypothetical protein n=1 Tax=Nocardia farcinica TaxID=37329 RepID=UPI0018947342|nr:hypothetical protein [Nocardia farcinica]MBF6362646.1 hypothetical protein [Nocardia farcinica]
MDLPRPVGAVDHARTAAPRRTGTGRTAGPVCGGSRWWTLTRSGEQVLLCCDERVVGVELPAGLAPSAERYLARNRLTGPVLEFGPAGPARPGGGAAPVRRIHLAVVSARTSLALGALQAAGARIHADGAELGPIADLIDPGAAWAAALDETGALPAVVALAAAVRAVGGRARDLTAARAI